MNNFHISHRIPVPLQGYATLGSNLEQSLTFRMVSGKAWPILAYGTRSCSSQLSIVYFEPGEAQFNVIKWHLPCQLPPSIYLWGRGLSKTVWHLKGVPGGLVCAKITKSQGVHQRLSRFDLGPKISNLINRWIAVNEVAKAGGTVSKWMLLAWSLRFLQNFKAALRLPLVAPCETQPSMVLY